MARGHTASIANRLARQRRRTGCIVDRAHRLGATGFRILRRDRLARWCARIDAVIEQDAKARGLSADEVRDVYLRQTSMRTFISEEDVANMAVFLASEDAARVSGQVVAVDGYTEGLSNWLGK